MCYLSFLHSLTCSIVEPALVLGAAAFEKVCDKTSSAILLCLRWEPSASSISLHYPGSLASTATAKRYLSRSKHLERPTNCSICLRRRTILGLHRPSDLRLFAVSPMTPLYASLARLCPSPSGLLYGSTVGDPPRSLDISFYRYFDAVVDVLVRLEDAIVYRATDDLSTREDRRWLDQAISLVARTLHRAARAPRFSNHGAPSGATLVSLNGSSFITPSRF